MVRLGNKAKYSSTKTVGSKDLLNSLYGVLDYPFGFMILIT